MSSTTNIHLSAGTFFGLGHPVLDISTEVSLDFLQHYDLQVNNVVLAEKVSRYDQLMDEIVTKGMYHLNYSPGGSTQNALKTISWLIGQNDVTVCMGCIGDDESGRKLEEQMKNCQYQKSSTAQTGTCLILITDQARSMVTNLGAANDFTVDHLLRAEHWQYVERAKIFYIPGYFIRTCREAVLEIAEHCRETGKIFAFNLSAEYICQNFGEQIIHLLPFVNILFGNEQEARCFVQCHMKSNNDTDITCVAKELQKMLTKNKETCVVITGGANPIISVTQHGIKVFHVKKPSKIVDTIGCGDAFVGGFLANRSLNKPIDECINAACYCAYECLQQTACQFPNLSSFDGTQRYCNVENAS
ncbi:unnamed protein product [Adineta ricciae]|uniref:Adenosine kinase n=1 Tax=Adineta ricciae TaxID=249248 RepID=A0A814HHW4_ADIRI|nr:unnamed protein product [Adineta ricciae]